MKKKGLSQRGLGSYVPAHLNDSPFFEGIIPQEKPIVNSENELLNDRDIEPITELEYKNLEKHFGTTVNFRVAGYLLTNGKLLDFSGKHWGDTASRTRQVDHRDVQEVLGEIEQARNQIKKLVIEYLSTLCQGLSYRGEEPTLFSIPTADGQAPAPSVNAFLAVNANTKSRDAVKLFIESALGIESQYSVSSEYGIPVNTELINIMKDFYINGKWHDKYIFEENKMPEKITKTFFDTIENMNNGVYLDVQTSGKMFSVIREYIVNKADIETAYSVGRSAVEEYLAE